MCPVRLREGASRPRGINRAAEINCQTAKHMGFKGVTIPELRVLMLCGL